MLLNSAHFFIGFAYCLFVRIFNPVFFIIHLCLDNLKHILKQTLYNTLFIYSLSHWCSHKIVHCSTYRPCTCTIFNSKPKYDSRSFLEISLGSTFTAFLTITLMVPSISYIYNITIMKSLWFIINTLHGPQGSCHFMCHNIEHTFLYKFKFIWAFINLPALL